MFRQPGMAISRTNDGTRTVVIFGFLMYYSFEGPDEEQSVGKTAVHPKPMAYRAAPKQSTSEHTATIDKGISSIRKQLHYRGIRNPKNPEQSFKNKGMEQPCSYGKRHSVVNDFRFKGLLDKQRKSNKQTVCPQRGHRNVQIGSIGVVFGGFVLVGTMQLQK